MCTTPLPAKSITPIVPLIRGSSFSTEQSGRRKADSQPGGREGGHGRAWARAGDERRPREAAARQRLPAGKQRCYSCQLPVRPVFSQGGSAARTAWGQRAKQRSPEPLHTQCTTTG